MNIKYKDLIILGIIIGIAFFFIGAIISNVFPSSESNLLAYKASACIKLVGIGALTTSMIIGGIILEQGMDKNLKMLLLILGLILLIIYTVGAQSLQWSIPTTGMMGSSQTTAYDSRPTGYGVPGFEIISMLGAIVGILLIIKVKHRR